MAPVTPAWLSIGPQVCAPGTGTSVALRNSDASRCVSVIGKKSHESPQISRTGRSNRGIASAASMRSCGRNRPWPRRDRRPPTCHFVLAEERLVAVVVESARGDGGDDLAPGDRGSKLEPEQCSGEPWHSATQRGRLFERIWWELVVAVVALTVGQDERADAPQRRMTGGQRQQEQSTRRVVGDHRRILHVEQFEAVELQPSQRGGRSVRSRGQRIRMRSERQIDRDAAVAGGGSGPPPANVLAERRVRCATRPSWERDEVTSC